MQTELNCWNKLLNINCPCYGVIVFDLQKSGLNDKCVIVKTPPKPNGGGCNVGFPKGKSKKRENIFVGAARELEEETGIKFGQLQFANGVTLSETSNKGITSITYLVAKFMGDSAKHLFEYDKEELAFAGFLSLEDSTKGMWKNRQDIMINAYEIVTNPQTLFTDGNLILDTFGKSQVSEMALKENYVQNKTLNNTIDQVKLSKFMSFVLRHGAVKLGIPMDSGAWILVSDLLKQREMTGITQQTIEEIVKNNDKKRYELQTIDGNLMIRATQGHSKGLSNVIDENELLEEITVPLDKCIHGTNMQSWKLIEKTGLKKMERMHIHCSISEPDDNQVISGARSNAKVLIYINMELAMSEGIKFYLSKNKVILTDGLNGVLLPKYFKNVVFK